MTLNIERTQSTAAAPEPSSPPAPAPSAGPAGPTDPDRARLVDEVVNEIAGWSPREFVGAFHKWHQGSISLVHLNVLAVLEGHGPLPMSRLAEAMDISVASMTGVIDRMEKRGLVAREHDADDRRVVLVTQAPGARELFDAIDDRRRAGLSSLLADLDEDELEGLLRGHRALRAVRERRRAERASSEGEATAAPETAP